MNGYPPLFFYVDAVDEEFAHAPMEWHRCQKGLFYQVMRFVRDARLGARLHLVICVRDIVLSSVYQSEHASRYRNEPHIRVLDWDENSIEYFLRQKIDGLLAQYLCRPHAADEMERWLGSSQIFNTRRRVKEDLMQYILRHTRLIPRDVVQLGNDLSRYVYMAARANES